MKLKIPKSFQLFATKINVVFDNIRLNDKSIYGLSDYGKSEITLSSTQGVDKLSDDRIKDTFYHEKVHMILDMMNRDDLSSQEEFVDVFAKLLRQSDESAVYDNTND